MVVHGAEQTLMRSSLVRGMHALYNCSASRYLARSVALLCDQSLLLACQGACLMCA